MVMSSKPQAAIRNWVEPPLIVEGVRAALTTELFGREVWAYAGVDSTNDLARAAAEAGAAEGLLVVADEQRVGRGRRGRGWYAPAGGALLASLLLRPGGPLDEAFAPTMILA